MLNEVDDDVNVVFIHHLVDGTMVTVVDTGVVVALSVGPVSICVPLRKRMKNGQEKIMTNIDIASIFRL